jgi:hypothetical protein
MMGQLLQLLTYFTEVSENRLDLVGLPPLVTRKTCNLQYVHYDLMQSPDHPYARKRHHLDSTIYHQSLLLDLV